MLTGRRGRAIRNSFSRIRPRLAAPQRLEGVTTAVTFWVSNSSGFAVAWQHSKDFGQQTLFAVAHHFPLLLAVAVIPAALRAYFTLKAQPIPHWEFNLAEALLTVWRVLICAVALWVTLTPREWQAFKHYLHNGDQLQLAMQRLGAYLGRALHTLLWELLIFALAFWLLHALLSFIGGQLARSGDLERYAVRRKAFGSVLRNLILAPLALIYLITILRQAFS
jgi:hypothetical protein